MADPKLKRTTVVVGFSCDDGFSKKSTFLSKKSPEHGLLNAMYELSRIAHLYGVGDEAKAEFDLAKKAIEAFKSGRLPN